MPIFLLHLGRIKLIDLVADSQEEIYKFCHFHQHDES